MWINSTPTLLCITIYVQCTTLTSQLRWIVDKNSCDFSRIIKRNILHFNSFLFNSILVRKCSRYQFECRSTSDCIAIYNACDGIPQCADGSDEAPELGCPDSITTTASIRSNNPIVPAFIPVVRVFFRLSL